MARFTRFLALSAASALAVGAFAPAAEAKIHGYRHHGHQHHGHHASAKKAAALIPAHQKPGYAGIAAVPVPGLVDVGLGPVFPFGGWPK